MPKQQYALEPNGPKRLEISWDAFWKNLTVRLDGNTIGAVADQKALKAGQDFLLPDNSVLHIQLVQKFFSTELQVLRNGTPIPGSVSDPVQRLKTAYGIVFFVAGLNIVLGLIAALFQVEFLQMLGIGWGSVVFGMLFLILGFLTMRRSMVALIIAIIIFALDGILGLLFAIQQGGSPTFGVIARVILLIPMIQGVGAIQTLKRQSGQPTNQPTN